MAIDGWTRKSLGSFTQFIKGITYASEDYCKEDEGAIFLTIKCVSKAGGFKLEGIKYYRGIIHENEKLKEGDILISNTDLTRDGDIVGCPIMVPFLGANEVTMSMDLSKLVIDSFQVDSKFLYYKLMTDKVRRFMQDHASGSTVLHLQTKAVPTLELLIPDKKEEQEKIAEILSCIDRAIAQTEAIIAKQQRIKTGLMQDLLTKGIDENGNIRSEATHEFKDSAIGRIPAQWDVIKLRDTGTWLSGGTPSKSEETYWGSFMPWVCSKDMKVFDLKNTLEMITQKGVLSGSKVVPKDSVLIVVRGMILAHTFPVGYLTRDMAFNQDIKAIIPNENIYGRYLAYWFSTNSSQLLKLTTTATHGTKRLETNELLEFALCLPSKMEQKKIIYLLDKSQHDIEITKEYLQKLNSQKRGLMQDLLTGKVRVTNLLNQKAAAN